MKQSHYFLKTERRLAQDEKIISSQLLVQAGYVRESVAGRYFFLPIGHTVQQNIMKIVKEEMDAAGAQEMVVPTLHPLELWKETNRTNTAGFELMKVKDRRDAEFALGGTAEEMFVDLVRKFTVSYKDLPFHIYQFSNKFRDEIRARGGLLRVREFIMKDGYSFHRDADDFKLEYEKMKGVYSRIFNRLGLHTEVVESDNGYIGGEYCHEFVAESPIGESRYLVSTSGAYAAHEDVAVFEKEKKNLDEELKPMEPVNAPRGTTMEDGVTFHKLPLWQQIKDVMYVDKQGRYILAVLRGDFDVNENKLQHAVNTTELRHATEEEIRDILHTEPGFISPVGIKELVDKSAELIIVGDDSLRTVRNSYGGDNKKDGDLLNVNIDRDFKVDIEADIAMAQPGYKTKDGGELIEHRGIEVGNIFQLGYHYTKLMEGAVFTDSDGEQKPYYMGCYGIGIGRTMAAIVEKYHDDKGIMWPAAVAPFQVHLVSLPGKDTTDENPIIAASNQLYADLQKQGISVLYDDRTDKSPGEKFADSDLIGLPKRVIISAKTLAENKAEIKDRNSSESRMVPLTDLLKELALHDQSDI